jgi:hypothetical protein
MLTGKALDKRVEKGIEELKNVNYYIDKALVDLDNLITFYRLKQEQVSKVSAMKACDQLVNKLITARFKLVASKLVLG